VWKETYQKDSEGYGSVVLGNQERRMHMEKKEYLPPDLSELGDVEEFTKGQGFCGSDDQWWFIHYGEYPQGSG
jgi:hypothetical protein